MELISNLSLSLGPVAKLVLLVVAVIIVLAILRFVVNVAVSLFRTAVWIGLLVIVMFIVYSLVRARAG